MVPFLDIYLARTGRHKLQRNQRIAAVTAGQLIPLSPLNIASKAILA